MVVKVAFGDYYFFFFSDYFRADPNVDCLSYYQSELESWTLYLPIDTSPPDGAPFCCSWLFFQLKNVHSYLDDSAFKE